MLRTRIGVQVAEFLGCKKIKETLIEWLHQMLRDVADDSKQAAGPASAGSASLQTCPRNWHFTQVRHCCQDHVAEHCLQSMVLNLAASSFLCVTAELASMQCS